MGNNWKSKEELLEIIKDLIGKGGLVNLASVARAAGYKCSNGDGFVKNINRLLEENKISKVYSTPGGRFHIELVESDDIKSIETMEKDSKPSVDEDKELTTIETMKTELKSFNLKPIEYENKLYFPLLIIAGAVNEKKQNIYNFLYRNKKKYAEYMADIKMASPNPAKCVTLEGIVKLMEDMKKKYSNELYKPFADYIRTNFLKPVCVTSSDDSETIDEKISLSDENTIEEKVSLSDNDNNIPLKEVSDVEEIKKDNIVEVNFNDTTNIMLDGDTDNLLKDLFGSFNSLKALVSGYEEKIAIYEKEIEEYKAKLKLASESCEEVRDKYKKLISEIVTLKRTVDNEVQIKTIV